MDMVTASPPVSPNVVAAILMTQKIRLISGTLLSVCFAALFMGALLSLDGVPLAAERRLHRGDHVADILHASALAQAVHGPHGRTDIHAGHPQARGDDGANGAAAAEVGAVG